jgi:hypothetical protein
MEMKSLEDLEVFKLAHQLALENLLDDERLSTGRDRLDKDKGCNDNWDVYQERFLRGDFP